jgi:hypothetical protein
MGGVIVEIMVEVLMILAIATKEMESGRLSELTLHMFIILDSHLCLERYFKKLTGNSDIEDSLKRLDKLTQEEARMASAELMKITKDVHGDVRGVSNQVQVVDHRVQSIGSNISSRVQGVDDKLDQVNRSFTL